MLAGIEPGKAVDTQQGRKKQGLKAVQKCLCTVIQQGKVVVRMHRLIGLYRLLELGHHWAKGLLLVEPMGEQMHAHKRQMGCDPDHLCARGDRPMACSVMRAALATIEPPGNPPPVEMANAHRKRSLHLGDLVEEHPARARRVLVAQAPQQGLRHFIQLAPSTKGWTCTLIEVTLAQGKLHDIILLDIPFRMKSCTSALMGQWPFLSSIKSDY